MSRGIGVIAEDKSDVAVVNEILGRYFDQNKFHVRKFVGNGCGKLKQKCASWANNLLMRGCECVLVFHDLDKNNRDDLERLLKGKLDSEAISKYLIIIPIEEMEAWLLSEPKALQKAFSLSKLPAKIGDTESIKSPKEHLRKLIWKMGKKRYLNTAHNITIARHMSLDGFRRCKSFQPLHDYLMSIR